MPIARWSEALRQHLRPGVRVVELDTTINAAEFADACVVELLANMRRVAETL